MASSRRDALINSAVKLFMQHGYHATGIDRILADSGVAKMTLYKHFKSKDELILAALRRYDEEFRNGFMRSVERLGSTPRERLSAVYDALDEWFNDGPFQGCMFINACAEYGAQGDPIHTVCAEHSRMMMTYIRGLASQAGARDPEALAVRLVLLIQGAIVMAYTMADPGAAMKAKKAAELLIRDAID